MKAVEKQKDRPLRSSNKTRPRAEWDETLHDLNALKLSPAEQTRRKENFRSKNAKPAELIDLKQMAQEAIIPSRQAFGNILPQNVENGLTTPLHNSQRWPDAPPAPLPINNIDAKKFNALISKPYQVLSSVADAKSAISQDVDVERELFLFDKTHAFISNQRKRSVNTKDKSSNKENTSSVDTVVVEEQISSRYNNGTKLKRPPMLRPKVSEENTVVIPVIEMRRLRRSIQHLQNLTNGLQDLPLSDDDNIDISNPTNDDDEASKSRKASALVFRKTIESLTTMTVNLARKFTEINGSLQEEVQARQRADIAHRQCQQQVDDLTRAIDRLSETQAQQHATILLHRQQLEDEISAVTLRQDELSTLKERQAIENLFRESVAYKDDELDYSYLKGDINVTDRRFIVKPASRMSNVDEIYPFRETRTDTNKNRNELNTVSHDKKLQPKQVRHLQSMYQQLQFLGLDDSKSETGGEDTDGMAFRDARFY